MSFDLVLVYLKNGEAERINNSIGILNVLREHCKDEIDKNRDYLANFSDGSSIEICLPTI